jgi:hypothetical protein
MGLLSDFVILEPTKGNCKTVPVLKQHALRAFDGVELKFHTFILIFNGSEWLVSRYDRFTSTH